MRILFIENRYKTKLWELIAKKLIKKGYEVFFLIQNKNFKSNTGKNYILPYYKKTKVKKIITEGIKKIIDSNRGLNYFGVKNEDFIFYYYQIIKHEISVINPDIVFGEATLFHELITSLICKERKILYLHPSSSRYPAGRFSFYKYDTLKPYKGSKEKLKNKELIYILEGIMNRASLPDYVIEKNKRISAIQRVKDRLLLTRAYYSGEKFNTPAPYQKLKINRKNSKNLNTWESIAINVRELKKDDFYILYPMQMQPEANIDVWGYPYRNQTKVIEKILKTLRKGEKLILKTNPKSKYEISEELLLIIKRFNKKIILLKHTTKMEEIWDKIRLVFTVTGTISYECIFSNKPVINIGQGIQTLEKSCFTDFEKLRDTIEMVKQNKFPTLNKTEKLSFLNKLITTSYKGILGDGLHNYKYISDKKNLNNIIKAFNEVIKNVKKKRI